MYVLLYAPKVGVFARAQPHVVFVVVAGQQSNARMQHWQRGARNKQTAGWRYDGRAVWISQQTGVNGIVQVT